MDEGTCDDEATVARKTRTGNQSLGVLVLAGFSVLAPNSPALHTQYTHRGDKSYVRTHQRFRSSPSERAGCRPRTMGYPRKSGLSATSPSFVIWPFRETLLSLKHQEVIHFIRLHHVIMLFEQTIARLLGFTQHHFFLHAVVFAVSVAIDDSHARGRLQRCS